MNLSNRIYSRKVLYRLIYIYNFFIFVLNKNTYINFADKIDNIVKQWLDKIESSDYEKFDFSKLLKIPKKYNSTVLELEDYLSSFNPSNEEKFNNIVSYVVSNFVLNKFDDVSLDYQYVVNNMQYIVDNYDNMILNIDTYLDSFKFDELNSVDQSILLLWIAENKTIWTHKNIIIKECLFLASTFTSDSSTKLINAVLDKVIVS